MEDYIYYGELYDLYQQLLKRTLNALHGYSRDNKEEIKKLLDNCNK